MKYFINFSSLFCLRKSALLVLMVFIMVTHVKSQNNYVEVGKKYTVAKLMLNNYQSVKAKNLVLTNDSTIYYVNSSNGIQKVIHVKDVKFLSEKNGSYALKYGLIGAGIGLTSVLFAQMLNNSEDVNLAPMYLGFTAGGAVFGAIIGASSSKWKVLYFQNKSTTYFIGITPSIDTNYCGLGLKINF